MGDAADAARDPDMLRLENLDTDIPPPQAAIEATRAAASRDDANSYLPFLGTDALRQAVVARLEGDTGIAYDWRTQCVISAGGLSGILNALLAMLEPGDEVIISDPAYAGLINRIRLAGGVPRLVPLRVVEGGWRLDLEALAEAASAKTRVVLTMSPSMPSGIVHTAEEWQAIAAVVRQTGAWLLHDAAMERLPVRLGAGPAPGPDTGTCREDRDGRQRLQGIPDDRLAGGLDRGPRRDHAGHRAGQPHQRGLPGGHRHAGGRGGAHRRG